MADAAQIRKVCDIVAAEPSRRIVVVSAPGKRNPDDTKVTDMLIECARLKMEGRNEGESLQRIVERFAGICRELDVPMSVAAQIEKDLQERLAGDVSHKDRFMDTMKAAGEDNAAKMVAAVMTRLGMQARYVGPREAGLLLSDEYGQARILPESAENLARLADTREVVVFPGFFGYTKDGHVVTFSRGGSDITGSILAAAVQAEVYENFTDVDSVFAADPRIVPDVRPIVELSYREMRELSYAGFGVLHDEAIVPAVRAGIPICIKNTNRPASPGTTIVPEHLHAQPRVVGIASSSGFCTIYMSKYLMNREIGFGRRLLQIFEEEGLSYEHIPSGIDNLSIILQESGFTPAVESHVVQRIRQELSVDDVDVERGLAIVMIVGEGMRYAVGLAARASVALAGAGVNIEMMNQGSSEISMMFGVKADDREKAVRALYDAFFREEGNGAADRNGAAPSGEA